MTERSIAQRFETARAKLTTLAVTGTNGKTTTVSMIASIVEASGEPSAKLTTLGAVVANERIEAPDPSAEFLATVETAARRGVRTLALEVTSKALAAGLAQGWPANVAVFTNLTRDHLDMHRTGEHYLASKAQLFIKLAPRGIAVLNHDDESSALLREVLPPHAAHPRSFSRGHFEADLAASGVSVSANGTVILLAPSPLADALGGILRLSVVGRVHAGNAMAAALAADSAGYSPDAIIKGLADFAGVPGRFEIASTAHWLSSTMPTHPTD